jgi:hypothetical protein
MYSLYSLPCPVYIKKYSRIMSHDPEALDPLEIRVSLDLISYDSRLESVYKQMALLIQ